MVWKDQLIWKNLYGELNIIEIIKIQCLARKNPDEAQWINGTKKHMKIYDISKLKDEKTRLKPIEMPIRT